MLIVGEVHVEAAGQDIARSQVGLNLEEIAEAPENVAVRAGRQLGNDDVVVFAIEGVVEPGPPLADGAGQDEARRELIESDSTLVLQRWEEVGGDKAEVVVASRGIELDDAAGAFSVFGRDATGLDIYGTKRIGRDAQEQLSVGGLGDVEAVKQDLGLIGFSAGDVRLDVHVIDDLRNVFQRFAVVPGRRVRKIDDIDAADLFLRADLFRIDGRRRFRHIDRFAYLPLTHQREFKAGCLVEVQIVSLGGVEVFLFDPGFVVCDGGRGQRAHAGGTSSAQQGRRSIRSGEFNTGIRDADTIFVDDGDSDALRALPLGAGAAEKKPAKKSSRCLSVLMTATEVLSYCRLPGHNRRGVSCTSNPKMKLSAAPPCALLTAQDLPTRRLLLACRAAANPASAWGVRVQQLESLGAQAGRAGRFFEVRSEPCV